VERALHTRLRAGAEDAYDELHARVPDDLAAALRDAGVRGWRIWRDGLDVFHLVDVEDYHAMRDFLREHPANVAWQARVTRLQSLPDDYSGEDDGLLLVWSLSAQLADWTREGS
jgi:L-rhamnose mutarotase